MESLVTVWVFRRDPDGEDRERGRDEGSDDEECGELWHDRLPFARLLTHLRGRAIAIANGFMLAVMKL